MQRSGAREMKIVDVKAYPTSFRVPKERQVSLGIGTMTKRDCVMVKVTTEDGIIGWGESHHARSPGSIGHLINTTLRASCVGMDATDTTGIWARIYKFQLGSHGMGAATAMAMSGIDQALWDIKGKARGLAALQAAGRHQPAGAGLCRRHFAGLPAAGLAGRRGRAAWSRRATGR